MGLWGLCVSGDADLVGPGDRTVRGFSNSFFISMGTVAPECCWVFPLLKHKTSLVSLKIRLSSTLGAPFLYFTWDSVKLYNPVYDSSGFI